MPAHQRLAFERALPGARLKSVVQSDKHGLIRGLKASLAEAMGKFSPDRTKLPITDPEFGGTIGRTLDASVADWTINMMPSPPEGAPNVLLILIDDSGFGNPGTFGGPVTTPNMTRVGQQGLTYNRFHVTAMCSPTRAALLTGRNNHAVGWCIPLGEECANGRVQAGAPQVTELVQRAHTALSRGLPTAPNKPEQVV